MRRQETQTFRGEIKNVKNVSTRSGRKMITFEVDGYHFKAFGDQADAVERLQSAHAEIAAKHNTFHGKDEYAVVTVAGEVGGHRIQASDTRGPAIASSRSALTLKNPGRHNGNPKDLIQRWIMPFIDELTPEEWRVWSTDNRFKNDRVWPRYPEESREHHVASYTMTADEEVKRLPDVKARFENRLNEVRMALREEKCPDQTQPPAMQTQVCRTVGKDADKSCQLIGALVPS